MSLNPTDISIIEKPNEKLGLLYNYYDISTSILYYLFVEISIYKLYICISNHSTANLVFIY